MISPDGRYAVFTNIGPVETIWIHDFLRNTQTALTSTTAGSSQAPLWTADGRRIVYRGSRLGFRNLFWTAADGGGTEERLAISENLQTPTSWSSDRDHIAFVETAPVSGADVWVLSLETRKSLPFLKTTAGESAPRFSPDGRLIAYTSTESGRREVYVRPYPGAGGRLQASNDGGFEPVWSHSGEQLFYRHDEEMMSVTMTRSPVLTAGSPRKLFAGNYLLSDTGGAGYDVAADGRFLMIQPLEPELPATTIDVVINWFDDLRGRLAEVRR
jgi:serine/threonine-protein kinase